MQTASNAPAVSDIQTRLERLDPSDDEYRSLLHELLSHQGLKPHIHCLNTPGFEGLVEVLDRVGSKANINIHRN